MADTTTYLAAPATSGYTEDRQATYRDDGTISDVKITVTWNDGTVHEMTIGLLGPPEHAVSVTGSLVYPDGSRTNVGVGPTDGTLAIRHSWEWASMTHPGETEYGLHTWEYGPYGDGHFKSTIDFQRGNFRSGYDTEWHSFDRNGALTSGITEVTGRWSKDGSYASVDTHTTLDGIRTEHTVLRDANDDRHPRVPRP